MTSSSALSAAAVQRLLSLLGPDVDLPLARTIYDLRQALSVQQYPLSRESGHSILKRAVHWQPKSSILHANSPVPPRTIIWSVLTDKITPNMSTADLDGVLKDLESEWSIVQGVKEFENMLKEAAEARRAGRPWNMPPSVKQVADSLYESRRAELAAAPGVLPVSRAAHHKHKEAKPLVSASASSSSNGSKKASNSKYAPSVIDSELEAIARKIRCRTPEITRSVDNALMHLLGDLLRPPPPIDLTQPEEDEDMPETAYDEDSGAEDEFVTPQHEMPALTMIDPRRLAAAAEQEQQRLMALAAAQSAATTALSRAAAPSAYASKSMPQHYGAGSGLYAEADDDDLEPEEEDEDESHYSTMQYDTPAQYPTPISAAARRKSKLPQKGLKYPQSAGKGLLQQPSQRAAAAKKSSGQYVNVASSIPPASAAALAQATEVSATGKLYTPPSAKPFACPTPGCNARYKQANGLKYHRLKGKCITTEVVQQASGREAKPFVCHDPSCGKRYKNLNGLRYHYQHSGSHGIIGSQLLAAGSHPPPQRGAGSYNDDLSMDREGSVDSSGSGGY